jgi:hypothetical protein
MKFINYFNEPLMLLVNLRYVNVKAVIPFDKCHYSPHSGNSGMVSLRHMVIAAGRMVRKDEEYTKKPAFPNVKKNLIQGTATAAVRTRNISIIKLDSLTAFPTLKALSINHIGMPRKGET